MSAATQKGELKFSLNGEKLKGSWVLVRTRDRQWLLIKHRDYYTTEEDVTEIAPASILTRRTLAEIAEDEGGDVKKAATGDPKKDSSPHRRKAPEEGRQEEGLAQQGQLKF